jgi:hypothetical protein
MNLFCGLELRIDIFMSEILAHNRETHLGRERTTDGAKTGTTHTQIDARGCTAL